jgi:hypothetical protein
MVCFHLRPSLLTYTLNVEPLWLGFHSLSPLTLPPHLYIKRRASMARFSFAFTSGPPSSPVHSMSSLYGSSFIRFHLHPLYIKRRATSSLAFTTGPLFILIHLVHPLLLRTLQFFRPSSGKNKSFTNSTYLSQLFFVKVNVFELGHTYLQLVQTLNLRIPLVDPSHYISRFASLLEFGDEAHKVATSTMPLAPDPPLPPVTVDSRLPLPSRSPLSPLSPAPPPPDVLLAPPEPLREPFSEPDAEPVAEGGADPKTETPEADAGDGSWGDVVPVALVGGVCVVS